MKDHIAAKTVHSCGLSILTFYMKRKIQSCQSASTSLVKYTMQMKTSRGLLYRVTDGRLAWKCADVRFPRFLRTCSKFEECISLMDTCEAYESASVETSKR